MVPMLDEPLTVESLLPFTQPAHTTVVVGGADVTAVVYVDTRQVGDFDCSVDSGIILTAATPRPSLVCVARKY